MIFPYEWIKQHPCFHAFLPGKFNKCRTSAIRILLLENTKLRHHVIIINCNNALLYHYQL